MATQGARVETTAFSALYSKLQRGIKSGLPELVSEAYSRGLIPPNIKDESGSRPGKPDEKAMMLLDAIQQRIENYPDSYDEFADILETILAFRYLASEMREKKKDFGSKTQTLKELEDGSTEPEVIVDTLHQDEQADKSVSLLSSISPNHIVTADIPSLDISPLPKEDLVAIMRYLLPELKKYLDLDEIVVYLLSEDVISYDDLAEITVTDKKSKNSAIVRLYNIVKTKGAINEFLTAIQRSSEEHASHKQLIEKIEERKRRGSLASQSLSSQFELPKLATAEDVQLVSFNQLNNSPSRVENDIVLMPLVQAPDINKDDTSPSCSPESSQQMQQESEICSLENEAPSISTQVRHSDRVQRKRAKTQHSGVDFCWGCFFNGIASVVLILTGLALTAMIIGILNFLHLEHCGTDALDDAFGSYNFLFGATLMFGLILVTLIAIYYMSRRYRRCTGLRWDIILCFGIFLEVIFLIVYLATLGYSFSLSRDLYPVHTSILNNPNITLSSDCSTVSYYSTLSFLIIMQAVTFIVAVVFFIGGCIAGFVQFCQKYM